MFRDFSAQSLFMGLLVAFVGFASSFSVVLQGLEGSAQVRRSRLPV
nr:hypothetical protein [Marinicella sp. W31]MDC2878039.1 hypothetical protein [Marinicella sp. W31]